MRGASHALRGQDAARCDNRAPLPQHPCAVTTSTRCEGRGAVTPFFRQWASVGFCSMHAPTTRTLEETLARASVTAMFDLLRRDDELRRELASVLRDELRLDACEREKKWLTYDEAASRLGVSSDAVRMRARRGRLVTRNHGRRVYVSAASVDDLGLSA